MMKVMGRKVEGKKERILKTIVAEEMLKGGREMILKRGVKEEEVTGRRIIVGGAGLLNLREILGEKKVTRGKIIVTEGAGLLNPKKILEEEDEKVLLVEGQG